MTKKRKNDRPEDKIELLRQHLVEGTLVSEICDRNQHQPNVFYRWQRQFFEKGAQVFETGKDRETAALNRKITKLHVCAPVGEEKLVTKNEVLGELREDHIELKKSWGDPSGKWITQEERDRVVDFV